MSRIFDVVIVGGGHNGMVAAIALLKAGYSVCILESREQAGGCAITTQPLLPGFLHSPHANSFLFADILPQDILPAELGVQLSQPEAQLGVAFADGRSPVILHRPDLLAATRASLAVYSRKDAARYVELKRRSARMGPILKQGLYAFPNPVWFERQRQTVRQAYGSLCDPEHLGKRTAAQLIDALFDTPEIRLLLYALAIETGVGLHDPGSDLGFLGFSLWVAGRWRVPIKGMQAYSNALRDAAYAAGARMRTRTPVKRVIVSDGRATGVQTAGGEEIFANHAVVAAIPVLTLFDQLLDADHISAAEKAELNSFRRNPSPSVATSAFCIDWAPRYKSGLHDAQIDRCLKTVVGFESPDELTEYWHEVGKGLLPRPAGVLRMHSMWDPTLAPPGCHIVAADSNFPSISAMASETWRMIESSFATALFDTWGRYQIDRHDPPPMITSVEDAPGFERRMLLRFGAEQYRTSVGGLYMAGPGIYPGGGVHGACGHNAAAAIVEDVKTQ